MSIGRKYLSLIALLLKKGIIISFEGIFFIEKLLISLESFVRFRNSDVVIFEIVPKVIDNRFHC